MTVQIKIETALNGEWFYVNVIENESRFAKTRDGGIHRVVSIDDDSETTVLENMVTKIHVTYQFTDVVCINKSIGTVKRFKLNAFHDEDYIISAPSLDNFDYKIYIKSWGSYLGAYFLFTHYKKEACRFKDNNIKDVVLSKLKELSPEHLWEIEFSPYVLEPALKKKVDLKNIYGNRANFSFVDVLRSSEPSHYRTFDPGSGLN